MFARILLLCLFFVSVFEAFSAEPAKAPPATQASDFVPILYAAEGANSIQYYNREGKLTWEYPAAMSRDVQLLPNGNVLFSYNNNYDSKKHDNPSGVTEITSDGKIVFEFKTTGQVWACDRLANGLTVVGAASQGLILLVNPKGAVESSFKVKSAPSHSCLRHVRGTPNGTILVAEESAHAVREYTLAGELVREIKTPFPTFSVLRLPNGNTVISGGNGILEVDPEDHQVWELKSTDIPEMGVRYLAGIRLLENGNLLVCNAGGKVPLFQVTREAKPRVVWTSPKEGRNWPFGHGVALAPNFPVKEFIPPSVHYPFNLPGGAREIVFTTRTHSGNGHWYANFGYSGPNENEKYSGKRGRLCKLDLKTGQVITLIEDLEGAIRDAKVSYDAKQILFSWRKGTTDYFHLYECGSDGSNIRQLTFGPWDDFEPCYLPDRGIMFVSSRCKRWVNCMQSQVATLFRCDADGKNIVPVSGNIEQDNSPCVLPDGRVIYTRWEYVDRSQMVYHHLWTMNPDGTQQMVYFGNLNPGTLMIDAKPVPGTHRVVAAISSGHGARDHYGQVSLLSDENGPDDPNSVHTIRPSNVSLVSPKTMANLYFAKPYPLSPDLFLVGYNQKLLLMDGSGGQRTLLTFPDPEILMQDAQPLVGRAREPVISSRVDFTKTTGQLICQNVYVGRRMEGVEPGEIKKLLVLETLPKPVNFDGMTPPISYSSTFSLERILGTVPVEPDGSANFEVPANRSIQLVALDGQNRSVKRMQSFLSVMPGEVNSCVGCHELRTQAPASPMRKLAALQRGPSQIQRLTGIPEIYDFPRDIQPILDEHCLQCHSATNRSGGVELTGDRNPWWSMSYFHLMSRMQVFVGGDLEKSNFPLRTLGDCISPLMSKIQGANVETQLADTYTNDKGKWPRLIQKASDAHSGVHLSPDQIEKIRFWINSGAVYAGTYAALGGSGSIGWKNQNATVDNIKDIPSIAPASHSISSRCAACHDKDRTLPLSAVDELHQHTFGPGFSGYSEADYLQPALRTYSRFRVFNLTHPDRSLMLLAPLAKSAGGLGLCTGKDETPVFANPNDPDYQTILASIRDTGKRLDEITRFDMPVYRPSPQWVREMKRFGLLPKEHDANTPVNPYEVEKRYFESLGSHPMGKEAWGPESAESEAALK